LFHAPFLSPGVTLLSLSRNLDGMSAWKKPYYQALFVCFVQGKSAKEAGDEAGCSEPTARKFREQHLGEITKAQSASTVGVLASLETLLPDAVRKLGELLAPPPVPIIVGGVVINAPGSNAGDIRAIRTVFDCYDTMRDIDFETRLKAVEKRLADADKAQEKKE